MKASPGKDHLIVEEGSMTRSQAKRIKEVMWLLVQTTMDETSIIGNKDTIFMLGLGVETGWFNLIQVVDDGTGLNNYIHYATAFSQSEEKLRFHKWPMWPHMIELSATWYIQDMNFSNVTRSFIYVKTLFFYFYFLSFVIFRILFRVNQGFMSFLWIELIISL